MLTLAAQVAAGERETGGCHSLEGTPLPLDSGHLPDYAAYPYTAEGLPELGLFLSRGCPYNAPACLLRPGRRGLARLSAGRRRGGHRRRRRPAPANGGGTRPGVRRRRGLAAHRVRPARGRRPARPHAQRRRPRRRSAASRRRQALSGAAGLVLEVGSLSPALLSRTGQAPYPRKAVAHALELLEYLSAKGVVTRARFEFNQPGETEESAAETLDALERFVLAVPNTSVTVDAQPWAYLPIGEEGADLDAPAERYGTRILHPEWSRRGGAYEAAAKAVVASAELAELAPGDDAYWRPALPGAAGRARVQAHRRRAPRHAEPRDGGVSAVRRAPRLVDGAALALTAATVCPHRGHRLYFLGRSGPR